MFKKQILTTNRNLNWIQCMYVKMDKLKIFNEQTNKQKTTRISLEIIVEWNILLFHYFVYSVCIVSSLIRYHFLYIDPIKKKPEIVTRTQKKKKRFEKIGNNELRAEIHFSVKKKQERNKQLLPEPQWHFIQGFLFQFFLPLCIIYNTHCHIVVDNLWNVLFCPFDKTNETIFQSHSNLSSVILYLFETKYPKYDHLWWWWWWWHQEKKMNHFTRS